jgi:hypothetical protein
MSRVVSRARCPSCAKVGRDRHGDNLAIYDDGGEYCWSCGYTGPRRGLKRPTAAEQPLGDIYPLPYDVDTVIPATALEWLKQFHITYSDIVKNNILWSDSREMLIFPYDNAWQGRYFGKGDRPKWFSQGKLDEIIHGFNLKETPIILVEDIVSCIRIGNTDLPVCCLFGSFLSDKKLLRLLRITDKVIFWLDNDKKRSAMEQALRLQEFGMKAGVIITDLDPKCHSDGDIKKIVANHQNN